MHHDKERGFFALPDLRLLAVKASIDHRWSTKPASGRGGRADKVKGAAASGIAVSGNVPEVQESAPASAERSKLEVGDCRRALSFVLQHQYFIVSLRHKQHSTQRAWADLQAAPLMANCVRVLQRRFWGSLLVRYQTQPKFADPSFASLSMQHPVHPEAGDGESSTLVASRAKLPANWMHAAAPSEELPRVTVSGAGVTTAWTQRQVFVSVLATRLLSSLVLVPDVAVALSCTPRCLQVSLRDVSYSVKISGAKRVAVAVASPPSTIPRPRKRQPAQQPRLRPTAL